VPATALGEALLQLGGHRVGLLGGDRSVVDQRLEQIPEPRAGVHRAGAHWGIGGGVGGRIRRHGVLGLLHDVR